MAGDIDMNHAADTDMPDTPKSHQCVYCSLCVTDVPGKDVVPCGTCSKPIHVACFREWARNIFRTRTLAKEPIMFMSANDSDTLVSCPFCRGPCTLDRSMGIAMPKSNNLNGGAVFLTAMWSWHGHVLARSHFAPGAPSRDEVVSIEPTPRHPDCVTYTIRSGQVSDPIVAKVGTSSRTAAIKWSDTPPDEKIPA